VYFFGSIYFRRYQASAWFGVVVTALVSSTKLSDVEPG